MGEKDNGNEFKQIDRKKYSRMKSITTGETFFKEETTEWEDVSEGITRQFVGFNT